MTRVCMRIAITHLARTLSSTGKPGRRSEVDARGSVLSFFLSMAQSSDHVSALHHKQERWNEDVESLPPKKKKNRQCFCQSLGRSRLEGRGRDAPSRTQTIIWQSVYCNSPSIEFDRCNGSYTK